MALNVTGAEPAGGPALRHGSHPYVEASAPAQVASLAAVATAMMIAAAHFGAVEVGMLLVVALVAGVAVGIAVLAPVRSETALAQPDAWEPVVFLARQSGLILGLCGLAAATAALILFAIGGVSLPPQIVLLAAVFAFGLDWHRVTRMRLTVVVSGLGVIPALTDLDTLAFIGGATWFVLAGLGLWLLEHDRRQSVDRPQPVEAGRTATGEPLRPADLVRTLLISGLVALLIGLLVAGLTSWLRDRDPDTREVEEPAAGQESGGGFSDQDPSGFEMGDGREQEFNIDSAGRQYVEGPNGDRHYRVGDADSGVVVDQEGRVVAEYGDGEFTAQDTTGGSGDYEVDENGELVIEGADGNSYRVREDGGELVLTDEEGRIAAEAWITEDHLYVDDPDGRVLIPDGDGTGRIPIPPESVREGFLGVEPGRVQTDLPGGGALIEDPDGSTREYAVADDGSVHVITTDPNGRSEEYTYTYDDSGEYLQIEETGPDGRSKTYVVDPQGQSLGPGPGVMPGVDPGQIDLQPDEPTPPESAPPAADAPADDAPAADAPADDAPAADTHDGGISPWLMGAIAATVVALGAVLFLTRRKPSSTVAEDAFEHGPVGPNERPVLPWSVTQLRLLESEGAARGRPRGSRETVFDYVRALATGPIPDVRLIEVERILSASFFGPVDPDEETRRRCEGLLGQVMADNPVPDEVAATGAAGSAAAAAAGQSST